MVYDKWISAVPSSGQYALHDAHVASQQHLARQPFSIVWADDTDSICDLQSLYLLGQPCGQPPQNKRNTIIPDDRQKR
jgi:hypothetical protein